MAYRLRILLQSEKDFVPWAFDRNVPAEIDVGCSILGHPLTPALIAQLPTKLIYERRPKSAIPSIIESYLWIVHAKIVEIAKELEPGVHTFAPIQLVTKSGEVVSNEYSFFHVGNRIDAIIPEKSQIKWRDLKPLLIDGKLVGGGRGMQLEFMKPKLVLSRQAIFGRHFWCGARYLSNNHFVSDKAGDRLASAALSHLELQPCDEE